MTARKFYGIFLTVFGAVAFLASCVNILMWDQPRKVMEIEPEKVAYVTVGHSVREVVFTDRDVITDLARQCNTLYARRCSVSPGHIIMGGYYVCFHMKSGLHQEIGFHASRTGAFEAKYVRFTNDDGFHLWQICDGEINLTPYTDYASAHDLWGT